MATFNLILKKLNQLGFVCATITLIVMYACEVNIPFLCNLGTVLGIAPVIENSYKLFIYIKEHIN